MTGAGLDRERMAQLLGMFSSDFDNEVVTAARMAERLRRETGETWDQILAPAALPPPTWQRDIETVADAISYCLEKAEALTDWESNFVATLGRQRSPISPKQLAVLDQILEKARRAEARAA